VAVTYDQGRVLALSSAAYWSTTSVFPENLAVGDTLRLWLNAIDWLAGYEPLGLFDRPVSVSIAPRPSVPGPPRSRVYLFTSSPQNYNNLLGALAEKGYQAAAGTNPTLANTDVLIVLTGPAIGKINTADLLALVRRGGGVLFTTGTDDASQVNSLASLFGLEYVSNPGLLDPEYERQEGVLTTAFEPHPVTTGVNLALMLGGGYGEKAPVLAIRGAGQAIARFSPSAYSRDGTYSTGDSPPAVVAVTYDQGRVLALSSAAYWSTTSVFPENLAVGDTLRLWLNAIDWLAGREPAQVTDVHIEQILRIQEQVANGEINRSDAEAQLDEIASEIGADALAWIVRRVPVYDSERDRWVTFDDFLRDWSIDYEMDADSRFAQDPVGTAADLMFGNYTTEELLDWFGWGEQNP